MELIGHVVDHIMEYYYFYDPSVVILFAAYKYYAEVKRHRKSLERDHTKGFGAFSRSADKHHRNNNGSR